MRVRRKFGDMLRFFTRRQSRRKRYRSEGGNAGDLFMTPSTGGRSSSCSAVDNGNSGASDFNARFRASKKARYINRLRNLRTYFSVY